MRDIRGDLQDRIDLLKEQIDAAQTQFERHIEQIKQEQDRKLADLRSDLDAANTLMEAEQRRLGGAPSVPGQAEPHRAQPKMRLGDFLMRKLSDGSSMSMDKLRQLAVREGYFADADSAEPALRETLTQIEKAGFLRQLPNGSFVLPPVTHTIAMRRAI